MISEFYFFFSFIIIINLYLFCLFSKAIEMFTTSLGINSVEFIMNANLEKLK